MKKGIGRECHLPYCYASKVRWHSRQWTGFAGCRLPKFLFIGAIYWGATAGCFNTPNLSVGATVLVLTD